ncbi:MAG: prepilin-type N-terminal cleavage/methylation domain-containing protein [Alphaproteobacteria bacterium]
MDYEKKSAFSLIELSIVILILAF